MRVAFHSDSFAKRARFGLSRYAHSLHAAISAKGIEVVPFSPQTEFGREQPAWLASTGFRHIPVPRKVLAPAWTWLGMPKADSLLPPFDLMHSIDVDYRAPTRKPWVVTFHDLGALVHPEYFSRAVPWLLRAYVRQVVTRADGIICVSQSTADELSGLARIPLGDRMIIIPEGVDSSFFERPSPGAEREVDAILGSSAPFFLFSGSMNPRKNLERTLGAFMRLVTEIPHNLVLVGNLGWDAGDLQTKLSEASATGRVILPGYVSDDVLRALLHRASGYLYPSLYEGFGLPILEAMAAGCPVLAGANSAMPEVAGEAAVLVDAGDEGSIEGGIRTLALDPAFASALSTAGLDRARQFSWARAGAETYELYRKLL